MASGCVVVAGRSTVSSHLIRDNLNGLLATLGNPDVVAKKILMVFSDAKLVPMLINNDPPQVQNLRVDEAILLRATATR